MFYIGYMLDCFTRHPKQVGENYFQHLFYGIKISLLLVYSGLALFIHAFFPFLFTNTASTNVAKINNKMLLRNKK